MKKYLFSTLLLFASLGFYFPIALAGTGTAKARDKNEYRHISVSVEHAKLYAAPQEDSQVLGSTHWLTRNLTVDPKRLKQASENWIPVVQTFADGLNKESIVEGWIRREDVVTPADSRRVVACWPVKSLTLTYGDYAIEASFAVDGTALIKEWADDPQTNNRPPQKVHIYMAKNLFWLEGRGAPGAFDAVYLPDEKRVYYEAGPAKEQVNFSEAELQGCSSMPRVSAKK